MAGEKKIISRRGFIKTAGAVGLGSALVPLSTVPTADGRILAKAPEPGMVPTRPFGRTGVQVSILALGGVLKMSDQLVFRQAINRGVTYWDTADSYGWGKNELAIGKYFKRFPEDRKKVFLITKSATSDPKKLTQKLHESLEKMQTSYVDLYCLHYVSDANDELTEAVKTWAEQTKAQGKIRLFGFSAHKNMEESMLVAAKLGWIDGIMMSYNYRLMVTPRMKQAVAACVKAGIGLTAMKTQAPFSANFYASIGSKTDAALKMTEKFLKKGFTAEQAKLMAVWENSHIASICSGMPSMTILEANVNAALSKTRLSAGDRQRLGQYAKITSPGYCAGCTRICESAMDLDIPIGDIMRYSMYLHSYGHGDLAKYLFRKLPAEVKANILRADYTTAEKQCPQNIQISTVLKKAYKALV